MRRVPLALIICLAVPGYANTIRCADGTMAKSGRGVCSHHGGVAASEPRVEQPTAGSVMCKDGTMVKPGPDACAHHGGAPDEAAASAAGATARCKDGTYSHLARHQGACTRHGGVARWMR